MSGLKRPLNELRPTTSPYANPLLHCILGDPLCDTSKIFLSVGYSACHWCHVLAHESFEDNDIARVMNE